MGEMGVALAVHGRSIRESGGPKGWGFRNMAK